MRPVRLLDRRNRPQIGVDRVAVLARHLGVGGERHRRIDQPAVGKSPLVHHLVELIGRPCADPGLRIRRDVRRIERAERRMHRQAAGKYLAFARGVAGDAVAGTGEIFAVGDHRRIPWRRRLRHRIGRPDQQAQHRESLQHVLQGSRHRHDPFSLVGCRMPSASAGCRAARTTDPTVPDAPRAKRQRP